ATRPARSGADGDGLPPFGVRKALGQIGWLAMELERQSRGWSQRLWPGVRIVLGVLLLIAAALKLVGTGVDAVPQVYVLSTPPSRLLAVEIEAALGLWLLLGVRRRAAWFGAVGLFSALTVLSGYLVQQGFSSCGCLGPIPVAPTQTLALDVVVLTTLFLIRP